MDLRDKIAKLLALAGNNPNQAEAIAAITKARALMAEHGLSEQDVAGTIEQRNVTAHFEEVISRPKGSLPQWQASLAVVIARAFRCTAYHDTAIRGRDVIVVVGLREDVAVVQDTLRFATRAAIDLAWQWVKGQTPHPDEAGMNGYYIGFANGLSSALTEQNSDHPEWGLVMAQHAVVKQAVDDLGLQPGKSKMQYTHAGLNQGYTDGYNVGKGDRVGDAQHAAIQGA